MALNYKNYIKFRYSVDIYDKIYNNNDNSLFNRNYEVNTMTSTGKWRWYYTNVKYLYGYQDYLSDGPPFACKSTNMIKKENKLKEKKSARSHIFSYCYNNRI